MKAMMMTSRGRAGSYGPSWAGDLGGAELAIFYLTEVNKRNQNYCEITPAHICAEEESISQSVFP